MGYIEIFSTMNMCLLAKNVHIAKLLSAIHVCCNLIGVVLDKFDPAGAIITQL